VAEGTGAPDRRRKDVAMLDGHHVRLRAVEREDLPRLHELFDDDLELMTRLDDAPPRPMSLAEREQRFDEQLEESDRSSMWFAIQVDDELIGECGLHSIDHYRRSCQIGIALGRDHWGKGLGQDAVRTLVGFAFRDLNMRKVGLEVLADDDRAVGAYRKAGFVEEGRLRSHLWYDGTRHDELVMSVLRDDWKGDPTASSEAREEPRSTS
jgi:RimJ/RimL family protein N-acetyltransferase